MKVSTHSLAWFVSLLGSFSASSALAQTAADVVYKYADAAELNLAREDLQRDIEESVDPGPITADVILGDPPHKNSLGEGARASSFVNDGGTFWVEIIADNNGLPNDNGSGEASTALQYLLRKDSETEFPILHVTGGQLALTDFGGGAHPLLAEVSMTATVWDVSAEAFTYISGSKVTLSGRGGTPASETFHYVFEADILGRNFLVTDADYHEFETHIGTTGVNIYDALVDIPAQEVLIDTTGVCLGCEFYLTINAYGIAENPGGESASRAYFRDPLHIGGADPNLGPSYLELAGVTVLPWVPKPVPEPESLAWLAVALPLLTRRSITRHTARRWFARASSIRRKSTKRC